MGNNDKILSRFLNLHDEMCEIKKTKQLKLRSQDLMLLKRKMGKNLQIIISELDGIDVAGCAILISKQKAYYLYAAANETGRKHDSSNGMVWFLIEYLVKNGFEELDTSGVDPYKFWGGYNFKKRFSTYPVEYVGEWEYCSNKLLRMIINIALLKN